MNELRARNIFKYIFTLKTGKFLFFTGENSVINHGLLSYLEVLHQESFRQIRTLTSNLKLNCYYFVEQGSSTVNFQPASITATANFDNNIILLSNSKLTIVLSNSFTLTNADD